MGPNEVLNIACIGVGGKGSSDTEHVGAPRATSSPSATSTRSGSGEKAEKFTEAKTYSDFRKLLEELGPKIDAVVVSARPTTPTPRRR